MKYFLNLNDSVSCQQDVGQFFKDRLYGADYFHRSLKKLTGLQPIYIAWSGSCSIFDQEDFTWWTLAGHNRYCCQKIQPGSHGDYPCLHLGGDRFVGFIYQLLGYKIRIRPETYITKYIDPTWRLLLQTPPFPEHIIDHSLVSQTSAVILTALFDNNFQYDDTVEMEYSLPMHHYSSFQAAAAGASVSRLYGGIHYRPAIDYGIKQGRKVGDYLLKNIKTKSSGIALYQ